MAAGDAEAAEDHYRRALSLNPDCSEALVNLGLLREQAGAPAEAETCYRRAIALNPRIARSHLNLGVLLVKSKRFDEAESIFAQALALEPNAADAWSNLGVLLACTKREDEAEQCYRTALALDGNYLKARFNLSYILLRQGRFEEGWACLEARNWGGTSASHFTCRRWHGEPLPGKSVIIGLEGGYGDMIQFCRYVSVLKDMGAARVALVCHPDLQELFGSLSGVDEVLSPREAIPDAGWDFWSPLMSLPHFCRTRLDNIPAPIPYLAPDPARVGKWCRVLPAAELRVGLAWKGNPRFENDADRSLPSLDVLAPLAGVTGVRFVSLQKGRGEDEARHPPAGLAVLALGHLVEDFADTAAIISSLDLVISVDTAIAHLAGALGKPCWVLLPDHRTDWRWLTGRSDTPWYPKQTRLFRQPRGGGWPPVVAAVVAALESFKTGRSGGLAKLAAPARPA